MTIDISTWLQDLGFGDYAATFVANAVDETVLPDLSDADLRELGVKKLGHRKKLLKAITANFSAEATVEPNTSGQTRASQNSQKAGAEHRQKAEPVRDEARRMERLAGLQ